MKNKNSTINKKIELWRSVPQLAPLKNSRPFAEKWVFPSGRQALSFALAHAGISRAQKVAIPEWSSNCVINAVGRYATPVPMAEVVKYKIKVEAVLIYEQWGWPADKAVMQEIAEYFEGAVLIHDLVDSAHFMTANLNGIKGFNDIYQINSLSKILGVSGGGLLKSGGKYLSFFPDKESEQFMTALEKNQLIPMLHYGYLKDIIKSSVASIDPHTKKWLINNDLVSALNLELKARQSNLRAMLEMDIADNWPEWMKAAVEAGAGPGIAPLLMGREVKCLQKLQKQLLTEAGIETSIYHFNWSGNPLRSDYEICLAFPVHGMINDVKSIMKKVGVK